MEALPTVSRWEVLKNRKRILANPLPFHHENFEKYGDIFKVEILQGSGIIFTRDPDITRHILQKQHKKYQKSTLQTKDLAKYIGKGILTSNGDHWRAHRRMVQPAFHKKKLEGLLGIMQLAIKEELEDIQTGKVQDVFPLMSDLAFQVVAKSLFSRSDIRGRMRRLQEITERNQRMLIKEMRQPYLHWWFRWSGQIGRHLSWSEEARSILNDIIEERIASGEDKDDLLDMLLAARYEDGSAMSRDQLIDEVMILFTAGHETTANALSFTLFFLARHPEIQEKVRLEQLNNPHSETDPMGWLSALVYTKCCIEEALRLYPPAYVIDRVALEDDQLEERSFTKGTLVLMSVYELHRHADFWEDPEQYRPERFMGEQPKDLTRYYYPFGAGPRMCVGNNFAMYEMVMAVSEIVSRYQLSTPLEAVSINPLISLKPSEVPIQFSAR